MAERVTTNFDYAVGQGDVFLSVAIGEGQAGTSEVKLGTTQLVVASGAIGNLRIGAGPELKGKTLTIKSAVNDVSTMTNRMSVTYRLTGGTAANEVSAKGQVDAEGKMLVFMTTVALS